MVLREFRFGPKAPVGVRNARACRTGDGGLVRRDRACAITCDEDAMYLLRKQFDRRSGDVRTLADTKVRGKCQPAPEVRLHLRNALANDDGGAVWRHDEPLADHLPQTEDRIIDLHEQHKRIGLVSHGKFARRLADGRQFGSVQPPPRPVGKRVQERKTDGGVEVGRRARGTRAPTIAVIRRAR